MAGRNTIHAIIRHPSGDKELEKMPLDQIKALAIQCLKIIENPTQRLLEMYEETFKSNSHDKKEYISLYKLARFEKVQEIRHEEKLMKNNGFSFKEIN